MMSLGLVLTTLFHGPSIFTILVLYFPHFIETETKAQSKITHLDLPKMTELCLSNQDCQLILLAQIWLHMGTNKGGCGAPSREMVFGSRRGECEGHADPWDVWKVRSWDTGRPRVFLNVPRTERCQERMQPWVCLVGAYCVSM